MEFRQRSTDEDSPRRAVARLAGGDALAVALALLSVVVAGCASGPRNMPDEMFKPSNNRPWKANMAVLPYARLRGDHVKVYNVRNCSYIDEDTYVLNYEDRSYELDDLESLDFIICPFAGAPSLAHTMLSFGFRDGRFLAISVEVRLEEGEAYSTIGGTMRQFEIMYVVADERDVIRLRTDIRKGDVYVYRSRATKEQVRALFVDVLKRVNTLKKHPEFYDTLMNNCTSNIVAHINRIAPGTIAWDPTSLLTGYSDRTAYSLGLLVDYGSFEETRRRAHVNSLAARFRDDPHFSERIRGQEGGTRLVDRATPQQQR